MIPRTTKLVPAIVFLVMFSSFLRNIWARVSVIRGLTANTGETTTNGALLIAKYIKVTPEAEAMPDVANQNIPALLEVGMSIAMCRLNINDT